MIEVLLFLLVVVLIVVSILVWQNKIKIPQFFTQQPRRQEPPATDNKQPPGEEPTPSPLPPLQPIEQPATAPDVKSPPGPPPPPPPPHPSSPTTQPSTLPPQRPRPAPATEENSQAPVDTRNGLNFTGYNTNGKYGCKITVNDTQIYDVRPHEAQSTQARLIKINLSSYLPIQKIQIQIYSELEEPVNKVAHTAELISIPIARTLQLLPKNIQDAIRISDTFYVSTFALNGTNLRPQIRYIGGFDQGQLKDLPSNLRVLKKQKIIQAVLQDYHTKHTTNPSEVCAGIFNETGVYQYEPNNQMTSC